MSLFPWLKKPYQQLASLLAQDRLPHAMLLSSGGGLGLENLAEHLTAALLCLAPVANADGVQASCGVCKSCQLTIAGSHPDVRLITPDSGKKRIRVEQIREALHFLQLTGQQGRNKVITITPAESMNTQSANALLKGLEEPPEGTYLILLTERPASLLATIRSRCFKLAVAAPEHGVAHQWLSEKIKEPEPVDLLLSICGDRPCEALTFYEQGSLEVRQKLHDDLSALFGQKLGPVEIGSKWNRLPLEQVLFWLLLWTTDISRFAGSKGVSAIRDPLMAKITKYTVRHAKPVSIFALTDDILSHKSGLDRQTNLNQQLVLEDILITWHDMIFLR